MFVLFGYQYTGMSSFVANVRIFGIFDTTEDCIERMKDFADVRQDNIDENIFRGNNYTFWYKETDDLTRIDMCFRNVIDKN